MIIRELVMNPEFNFNVPFRIRAYYGDDDTKLIFDNSNNSYFVPHSLWYKTITAINTGNDGVMEIEFAEPFGMNLNREDYKSKKKDKSAVEWWSDMSDTCMGKINEKGLKDEKRKENDAVNHPSHYTDGKIEVIDFIEDKKLGFHLGNAVKYISRAGKKDPGKEIEDLEKAKWYLERHIQKLKTELI